MITTNGISIVLPILNERDNIGELLDQISYVSRTKATQINELVFVDDGSRDGTVEYLTSQLLVPRPFRIKLIQRDRKEGTVSAQIIGARNASNDAIVIMDADLQHPIDAIPKMIKKAHQGYDLVIASRYVKGGRNYWDPKRGIISRAAVFLSHILLPPTRRIKDPISGFFLCNKRFITELEPFSNRYKILLYVISKHDIKSSEIPIEFIERTRGSSKVVNNRPDFVLRYFRELILYMKVTNSRRIKKQNILTSFLAGTTGK